MVDIYRVLWSFHQEVSKGFCSIPSWDWLANTLRPSQRSNQRERRWKSVQVVLWELASFTKRHIWSLSHVGSLWTGPVTKSCFGTVSRRKEKTPHLLVGSFLSLVCPWSVFVPWRFSTLPIPQHDASDVGNTERDSLHWPLCLVTTRVSCSYLPPNKQS